MARRISTEINGQRKEKKWMSDKFSYQTLNNYPSNTANCSKTRRTGRRLRQEYPTTVQIKLASTTAITTSYFFLCYAITLSVKLLTSYWKVGFISGVPFVYISISTARLNQTSFFKYIAEGLWKWSWTVPSIECWTSEYVTLYFHCPVSLNDLVINALNAKLNPICHLLTLLGARHILHVSGLRVN